jgi:hypothetical protein
MRPRCHGASSWRSHCTTTLRYDIASINEFSLCYKCLREMPIDGHISITMLDCHIRISSRRWRKNIVDISWSRCTYLTSLCYGNIYGIMMRSYIVIVLSITEECCNTSAFYWPSKYIRSSCGKLSLSQFTLIFKVCCYLSTLPNKFLCFFTLVTS